MLEPDALSQVVVFFDTASGQITRYGTMDPALNGKEGEDHILVSHGVAIMGMMVDLPTRTLVPVPADHPKTAADIAGEWFLLRRQRDALLASTDRYMVEDFPISSDGKAQVRAYRQALRDLTTTTTDPFAVVWPILSF